MISKSQVVFHFLITHRKYFALPGILILGLLPLLLRNPFFLSLLIMVFFWGTLASAWNLLGGFAGQISLGHTAFFGIGAYASTILFLDFGVSPWLGMLAGAAISISVGIAIGYPCFRLTSHFFALATIAFAEVLSLIASYWRGLTKGGVGLLIPFSPGLKNFMFEEKTSYAYVALAMMLGVIFVSYHIKKSRFGFYLNAIGQDQDAAESLGVNTHRCKMICFVISILFTSLAGTFYAQYFLFIDPETSFSLPLSIQLALLSIIGGLGTVFGPIIGAFVLTPLDVFLRGWLGGISAGLNFIVYGVILIIAVIYFPYGIAGWFNRLLSRYKDSAWDERMRFVEPVMTPPGQGGEHRERQDVHEPVLFQAISLSKRFGGITAVKDLTFEIRRGEVLGLIGPNGAGKTTIFNLISGFLRPDDGETRFKGERVTRINVAHKLCLMGMGRTFQLVKPFQNMTVLENVMVGCFCREKAVQKAQANALQIIRFVGLANQARMAAGNLTIADRKRLELGRALATEPELLLLDEVIAGLNPKETQDIIEIVKSISARGVTILMIEHVMKAVMALSDRIMVVTYGERIAEGTPKEISTAKEVIDAYLGEEYLAQTQ
jgi:branched-chain amino acid transport system permease protein